MFVELTYDGVLLYVSLISKQTTVLNIMNGNRRENDNYLSVLRNKKLRQVGVNESNHTLRNNIRFYQQQLIDQSGASRAFTLDALPVTTLPI